MQWERSKPLWPMVAVLGLLFMLAAVAPSYWQSEKPTQPELHVHSQPEAFPTESVLVEKQATTESELVLEAPALPAPVAIEPLPIRKEYDLDTLMLVRDMVYSMLDQLPEAELPVLDQTSDSTFRLPQVRVSSDQDRLAMLPTRQRPGTKQATPAAPPKTTREESQRFAALLLEAANSPEPVQSQPEPTPQLAQRPQPVLQEPVVQPQPPVTTAPQTQPEPQLVQPLEAEPTPAELPPLVPPPLRHRPEALIEQLENFPANSNGAIWSQQVLAQLRLLTEESSTSRPADGDILLELEDLYATGVRQSQNHVRPTFHNRWQRATQALGRRLILWRLLLDPEQPKIIASAPHDPAAILPVINETVQLLEIHPNGEQWRNYLLLDQLAAATSEGTNSPILTRAKLAQEALSRMSDPRLTELQRKFLTNAPLVQLQQDLRPWATAKVNLETLMALIERYESGREARYAAVIAQLQQRLLWSEDPQLQQLANHLQLHYRGANMRIAMSDFLLNRMLPKQEPIVSPVRDRIANTKVRGRAKTTTQLRVNLVPNPEAWHFGLEAFGKVYSDTRSDTWPARIRNAAKMQYQARKEISLNPEGLHTSPAQATARGRNELLGVDSQFDPVPILGFLLRDMARQKHKKSRPLALSQAKAKVVRQVKQRMDNTLEKKLDFWEQKFREKVLTPIKQLALLAEPLEMQTTQERAIMQLRLASSGQLAAHTLRPLAPSDSVLSMQMHESALNNAMMGLGLDGRRMTMLELYNYFTERFGNADATPPEDLPRRAVIEFAKTDAFRVKCDGDRLELIMSVVELSHRRDKIKNFQIHVHFRPMLNGLDVRLVRDGTLQFSGRRLKTGPRVVLHSIIGKLIVKDQEISLLNEKIQHDPRLAGLMVTQMVIEDGWIGLALGPAHPRRTAWRTPMPNVLPTPFLR